MKISFIIPGEPVAKGRPRVTKRGITYTPEKTVFYENLVKTCYMEQVNQRLNGALEASVNAYFKIPKSASKKKGADMSAGLVRPVKRPDLDNIVKAIFDSLNNIAFDDDSQVVELTVAKKYSDNPRVEVNLKEI